MLDNSPIIDHEPPKPLTELDVLRQQRNNLMVRLLDLETMLALQEDELRRLRVPPVTE